MAKDIRVIFVGDDPFARRWMVLLAARDWRTRVVGEVGHPAEILPYLDRQNFRIDVIVMDVDNLQEDDWLSYLNEALLTRARSPVILLVGSRPDHLILRQSASPNWMGYLLKIEIHDSLVWAIAYAVQGKWVTTPSTYRLAAAAGHLSHKPCVILDGRQPTSRLTTYQAQVARLAFIFSMERRDLADELGISEEWGYGLVREIYQRLGLKDLISQEVNPRDFFGGNDLIVSSFDKIKSGSTGLGKVKDMEALAFHLLTIPHIEEAA